MMIAIPNMNMPEHCYECLLRQGNCCLLLYEAIPPTVPLARLDDCPLIEIGDIQYKAFLEFNEKLMKKLEEHFLYGERRE